MDKARSGPAADLVYATGYIEAQQPVSVSSRITAPVAQVRAAEVVERRTLALFREGWVTAAARDPVHAPGSTNWWCAPIRMAS